MKKITKIDVSFCFSCLSLSTLQSFSLSHSLQQKSLIQIAVTFILEVLFNSTKHDETTGFEFVARDYYQNPDEIKELGNYILQWSLDKRPPQ